MSCKKQLVAVAAVCLLLSPTSLASSLISSFKNRDARIISSGVTDKTGEQTYTAHVAIKNAPPSVVKALEEAGLEVQTFGNGTVVAAGVLNEQIPEGFFTVVTEMLASHGQTSADVSPTL